MMSLFSFDSSPSNRPKFHQDFTSHRTGTGTPTSKRYLQRPNVEWKRLRTGRTLFGQFENFAGVASVRYAFAEEDNEQTRTSFTAAPVGNQSGCVGAFFSIVQEDWTTFPDSDSFPNKTRPW